MCKHCENMVGLPKDMKARTDLFDKTAESIDTRYFVGFMEKNYHEDDTPYAFIKQEVTIDSTDRSYGIAIDIKYCPFCGEYLLR